MEKQPEAQEKQSTYKVVRDAVMSIKSTDSPSVRQFKKVSFAVLFTCTTILSVGAILLML
ncbi:hypothetical protein SAMN06269250_1545 [Spirosoma fluviale]|uniref:Uncharacterized protein n=1 Tax=Spirosoma fluviale TaxID=1597977 RepID=A0A286FD25_9BACT|nr:hypothetical protein SAMN06269250_1545 [Spirosoma fluviale]